MNRKKITALLLSSVMALTPAMPAMAEQSTIVNYVDGTTDSTVETPDVTPTPLPEKKEGWETVDGVKYYYVNGEKITNKVKKIGKYTYCFDKTGKLVTNKPYYKVNSKTYYKIKKNGQATKLSTVETMAAVRLQKCKGNLKKAFNWSVSLQYAGNVKVSKKTPTEYVYMDLKQAVAIVM